MATRLYRPPDADRQPAAPPYSAGNASFPMGERGYDPFADEAKQFAPKTPPPRRRSKGKKKAERQNRRPAPRRKRGMGLTGRIALIAACVSVVGFCAAATVRLFLLPTEETIYVFDDSTPQYVVTDEYLPPAAMPVVSDVNWEGSDALALLETAQKVSDNAAVLLAQVNAPRASNVTSTVRVYVQSTGQIVDMNLEDYIIGVVSAEVPASYPVEAIKAQAVAARTYTVRRMASLGGQGDGKGGDVCTSPAHCQAYYSLDELHSRWGGSFDKYYGKIAEAVYATQGLILTYDGSPINAFYHASSGGRTANCEEVFTQALPYLRAVDSPGESSYSSYSSTKTYSREEFASILSGKTGVSIAAEDLENQISVTSRSDSNRINRISIAGTEYKGTTLQSWLSLRSTNVAFSFGESDVTLTVYGYGHGVGMSQTGAAAMADAGNSYATILTHYYTGTNIVPYK